MTGPWARPSGSARDASSISSALTAPRAAKAFTFSTMRSSPRGARGAQRPLPSLVLLSPATFVDAAPRLVAPPPVAGAKPYENATARQCRVLSAKCPLPFKNQLQLVRLLSRLSAHLVLSNEKPIVRNRVTPRAHLLASAAAKGAAERRDQGNTRSESSKEQRRVSRSPLCQIPPRRN